MYADAYASRQVSLNNANLNDISAHEKIETDGIKWFFLCFLPLCLPPVTIQNVRIHSASVQSESGIEFSPPPFHIICAA